MLLKKTYFGVAKFSFKGKPSSAKIISIVVYILPETAKTRQNGPFNKSEIYSKLFVTVLDVNTLALWKSQNSSVPIWYMTLLTCWCYFILEALKNFSLQLAMPKWFTWNCRRPHMIDWSKSGVYIARWPTTERNTLLKRHASSAIVWSKLVLRPVRRPTIYFSTDRKALKRIPNFADSNIYFAKTQLFFSDLVLEVPERAVLNL